MMFVPINFMLVEPYKQEEIKTSSNIIVEAKDDVVTELELGKILYAEDQKKVGKIMLFSRYDAKFYSYFDKETAKKKDVYFLPPDKIVSYVS